MNFKDQNTTTMQITTGMEQLFRMKISVCLLIIFLLLGATSCQKDTLLIPKVKKELQTTWESDNDDPYGNGTNKMGEEAEKDESGNHGEGGDEGEGPVTDKDGCDCDNDDDEDDGGDQPPDGGNGGGDENGGGE